MPGGSFRRQVQRLKADVGELVEKHERAAGAGDYTRFEHDPVGFIREVLDAEFWSAQVEMAESVRDHPLTAVQSCNSAGKTFAAAALSLWAVYALHARVIVTSARQDQLKTQFMREVARLFSGTDLPGELYTMSLQLGQDEHRGILATTAASVSALTGYHAPRTVIFADEAQGLDKWVFEGLYACATESHDRIVICGNPLSPIGHFYQVCNSPNYAHLKISAEDHPNVTEGRQVIPGGPTQVWIKRQASIYGRGSSTYRSRVLGEFPEESEDALFRREWLEAAARRWENPEWRRQAAESASAVLGCDIARTKDRSVVALRRGNVLVDLVSWRPSETDLTGENARRIRDIAQDNGIMSTLKWEREKRRHPGQWGKRHGKRQRGRIVVDVLGPGTGVVDKLKSWRLPVTEFNGGHRVSGRFLNRRVEAYWRLRDKLEAGTIAIPRNHQLFDELLCQEWEPTAGGSAVKLIDKEEIKDRLGRSPDLADATSYAFHGGVRSETVTGLGVM